jgi:hypothetical protein
MSAAFIEHRLGVEELRERISTLVDQRQQLRGLGASGTLLEQNRLQLCHSQRELCYALIERHRPSLSDAA